MAAWSRSYNNSHPSFFLYFYFHYHVRRPIAPEYILHTTSDLQDITEATQYTPQHINFTQRAMALPSSSPVDAKRKFEESPTRADSPLFMTQHEDFEAGDDTSELTELSDDTEPTYEYTEASEPSPDHPAFDQGLAAAEVRAMTAVKELHDSLLGFTSDSKSLQNMQAKAAEAQVQPSPQRHTIAMVGDTGAGKSALLNSITDVPKLATEVSGGESCTSVPTIYTHKLHWQVDEPYAAEIRYYDIDRCRQLLGEQVRAYNVYTFEFDNAWEAREKVENEQAASTALDIFRTLFCDQEEFESTGAAKEHLQACYPDDCEALVETMIGWCEDHFVEHEKEDGAGFERCTGENVTELNEQVDPLVAPNHTLDEPSLWPLVEKVTVGVCSSRVLEYVDIMDLPGKTDCRASSTISDKLQVSLTPTA